MRAVAGGCYHAAMTIFRSRATGPGTAGDIWVTTLHMSSSSTLAEVHSAFGTFVGTFGADLGAMWSTEQQISEYITDELTADGKHAAAQQRTSVSIKGTGSGNALDPRTSVVMGLRTALPQRSGRGRMYWPAPDDSHLTTTGLLATADALSLAGDMAGALATLAGTATPVIYHRATNTFTAITEVTVGQVLGTQRRRTNKVPANYQSTNL